MNKNILSFLAPFILFLFSSFNSYSQSFIQGTYVEIGINQTGGFEGLDISGGSPSPHARSGSTIFGFVANPQMNGWATFDGDFFAPGSPENGWGFEIDSTGGISHSNNCSSFPTTEIPGNITTYYLAASTYNLEWEAYDSVAQLDFKIHYSLEDSALFYTTTISITNNSSATIPNMYYYRNVDPDNNEPISFDFSTTNTIVSQHTPGNTNVAFVTATSTNPSTQPMSYLGLMALDTAGWVAGYGGFSNRDASDCYYGTGSTVFQQAVDSSKFADVAIFLAYRIQNLLPGATQTFKFATLFSSSAIPCALSSSVVSLSTLGVCTNGTPFVLTTGSPPGGIYDYFGTTFTTLDPSTTSGYNPYSYIYVDSANGCKSTASATLEAYDVYAFFNPIANVCNTALAFTLTGGLPAGGTYSGTGVAGSTFNPSIAGPGDFQIVYTYTDTHGCSDTASQNIHVDNCVGINEENNSGTFNIYPNPLTEISTLAISKNIVVKEAELRMYDVTGRLVMKLQNINSNEIKISKKELMNGIYFFKLINDSKEVASGKIVIN